MESREGIGPSHRVLQTQLRASEPARTTSGATSGIRTRAAWLEARSTTRLYDGRAAEPPVGVAPTAACLPSRCPAPGASTAAVELEGVAPSIRCLQGIDPTSRTTPSVGTSSGLARNRTPSSGVGSRLVAMTSSPDDLDLQSPRTLIWGWGGESNPLGPGHSRSCFQSYPNVRCTELESNQPLLRFKQALPPG